jgi:hypothetical protein
MATVIDISILNSVTIIIVFMLIFVGGWGMLSWVDPFKDKGKSFYGLLAFLLAVLVVLSRKTVSVILVATPWLILLLLIAFFFIFFAKVFGTSDSTITWAFNNKALGWVIFFVALILVFAIGNSFGQDLLASSVPGQPVPTTLPEGSVVNADGSVILPDGSIVVPDETGAVPGGSVATGNFGTNLVATLFHPKILGVLFLFLLGTLTILLLNTGMG